MNINDIYPRVPLNGGKRPIYKGWKEIENQVSSVEDYEIKLKEDTDVGKALRTMKGMYFITGEPSGIMVVDVDYKVKEGKIEDGSIALNRDILNKVSPQAKEKFLEAPTVATPSGGRHYYFKYNPLLVSKIKQYEGLDIIAGGYQIVAPNTIITNYNGEGDITYKLLSGEEIFDMPSEIFNILYSDQLDKRANASINAKATTIFSECEPIHYLAKKLSKNYSIYDFLEYLKVPVRNKTFRCIFPSHEDRRESSSIKELEGGGTIASCWSCGVESRTGMHTWQMVKEYYQLQTDRQILEKFNEIFDAGIDIDEVFKDISFVESDVAFNTILEVDRYVSEVGYELQELIERHGSILLQAKTGIGKTYAVVNFCENSPTDFTVFLAPTKSLCDQTALAFHKDELGDEQRYIKFYDNMTTSNLTGFETIIATYHKIDKLLVWWEITKRMHEDRYGTLPTLTVIVDECHSLPTSIVRGHTRVIPRLLEQADYTICMSANTNDIAKAYRGTGLYKHYIKVGTHTEVFNLDKLVINRVPSNLNIKCGAILQTIEKELITHNHVLVFQDNKNALSMMQLELDKRGISSVVITSENKNEDGVYDEYCGIIDNSKLTARVVFVTSTINAGVNIKNENVCLIAIIDNRQIDINKIEQFLGRIRSDVCNTAHLFLTIKSENEYGTPHVVSTSCCYNSLKSNIDSVYNYADRLIYKKHIVNRKLDVSRLWNTMKNQTLYEPCNSSIYVLDNVLTIDNIAMYEQARLDSNRQNYYNDEWLMDSLGGVKTRSIDVNYITDAVAIELEKLEKKSKTSLEDICSKILGDNQSIIELELYARGVKKPNDFTTDALKELMTEQQTNNQRKDMFRTIKEGGNYLTHSINLTEMIISILEVYSEKGNREFKSISSKNYIRTHVRNKNYPLSNGKKVKYDDMYADGDVLYWAIRKNCDGLAQSRNAITNVTLRNIINDSSLVYGVEYNDKTKQFVLVGKGDIVKTNALKKIVGNIESAISSIYNLSDDSKLYGLK